MPKIPMLLENFWSYYPQKISKHIKLTEIWRPKGYILLAEAIELLGKEKYNEEWTGQELYARSLPVLKDNLSGIIGLDVFASKAPAPLGSGYKKINTNGFQDAYKVSTCEGTRVVKTEEEATKLWKIEAPKLSKAYEKEFQERKRFEDLVHIIRTELYDGISTAFAVNKGTGRIYDVPKEVWGRERIIDVFEMGNNPLRWASPNLIQFYQYEYGVVINVEGSLLIKREETLSLIKPNEKNRPSTISAERRCEEELLLLMQKGKPQKTKPEYCKEMIDKLRISSRAFDRAWGKAITNSGNASWGKKGRRKNAAAKIAQ